MERRTAVPSKRAGTALASTRRPAAPSSGPAQSTSRSAAAAAPRQSPNSREVNIQVAVRCRGRSRREIEDGAPLLVSTAGTYGHDVVVSSPASVAQNKELASRVNAASESERLSLVHASAASAQPLSSHAAILPLAKQTYSFDHVFGPDADQETLFNEIVHPFVNEVLSGYNCTVFAYGQTGTGKTYTMEGETSTGSLETSSGVIPRVLHDIFHQLEKDSAEFTIKCSFVELYNEELRDLNATSPSSSPDLAAASGEGSSLRIYEDRSTGSGVLVQGLEETLISSVEDGLKILRRGSQRRQIAATNCNDQSSRSHSIFTLTVMLKESSSKGEEMLKVGKFNLVDLAGSENIGRSGAEKGRAREAGMINVSLLALGRVINKLVERQAHIPYRESKLTRLLQDSLGGRTKTCIIATISPVNLEETMSTLDYALRAKSIRNRPEVNQRMSKGALLNQYAIEIERLKTDLLAAREKNGVFLSPESWAEISSEAERLKATADELRRATEAKDAELLSLKHEVEQQSRKLARREQDFTALNTRFLELGSAASTQMQKASTSFDLAFSPVNAVLQSAVDTLQTEVDRLRSSHEQEVTSLKRENDNLKANLDRMQAIVESEREGARVDTASLMEMLATQLRTASEARVNRLTRSIQQAHTHLSSQHEARVSAFNERDTETEAMRRRQDELRVSILQEHQVALSLARDQRQMLSNGLSQVIELCGEERPKPTAASPRKALSSRDPNV